MFQSSGGKEQAVKLELVWRNPAPPTPTPREIEAFVGGPNEVLYLVRRPGETTTFELLLGGAA
ncbi:MAG: hypothetical protein JOZ43_07100 [Acidobacteriales bacterium]|nr:hypothetical protein [Terriglobales bacterium]